MHEKLAWAQMGETFVDGSRLQDWQKIFQSEIWHWQYDTHELTFAIYAHDGQFWKLYRSRQVAPASAEYVYAYGGVACRMLEVRYLVAGRSPHSALLKVPGDLEWIRTAEYNSAQHEVVRAGETNARYGAPYPGADPGADPGAPYSDAEPGVANDADAGWPGAAP